MCYVSIYIFLKNRVLVYSLGCCETCDVRLALFLPEPPKCLTWSTGMHHTQLHGLKIFLGGGLDGKGTCQASQLEFNPDLERRVLTPNSYSDFDLPLCSVKDSDCDLKRRDLEAG